MRIAAHAGLPHRPPQMTACSKTRRMSARRSPTEFTVLAAAGAGVSRSSSDDASSSGAEASPVPRTMRVDGATVGGAGVAAAAAGAYASTIVVCYIPPSLRGPAHAFTLATAVLNALS